ncbi:TRAP transporter small permease subunit [Chloroflexota bacterium]
MTIFMVYSSFIVSGAVLKQGSHVKMSVVYEHMPERARRWALIIISTVGTIMSAEPIIPNRSPFETAIYQYDSRWKAPWSVIMWIICPYCL